jgi:hypothetical protein
MRPIARLRYSPDEIRRAVAESPLFDADWYVTTHGLAVEDIGQTPLEHYLNIGSSERLSPGPLFDAGWYSDRYGAEGLVGDDPLADFLLRGVGAGRRPNRFFDPSLPPIDFPSERGSLAVLERAAEIVRRDRRRSAEWRTPLGTHPGAQALADGTPVAIYVHHDVHRRIDDYVVLALERLAEAGLTTVFVSACPTLPGRDLDAIRELVAVALTGANEGWDFGLYHRGLELCGNAVKPSSLTLMNDSVYVLSSLRPLFAELAAARFDLGGITDNRLPRHHVQSYFLHFTERALDSNLLQELRLHFVPVNFKPYVINAYEIGLSAMAQELGLRIGGVWEHESLATHAGLHLPPGDRRREWAIQGVISNPAAQLWDVLIARGCPVVKVSVLRDGADAASRLRSLEGPLARRSPETLRAIVKHLTRVRRA